MALQEINLVPDEGATRSTAKRTKIIIGATATILVVFVCLVGFVFLQVAQASSKLDSVRKQKEPLQKDIDAQVTTEKTLRALSLKLDAVDGIFKGQPPFEKIVNLLIELAGTSVTYTELSLNAPDKVLLSGMVANLDGLEMFLGTLTAKEFGRTNFSDIVLQSLGRSEKGEYVFTLRFTYIGK